MSGRGRPSKGDDMRALVKIGGYSPEEAERIMSRPKVKISAIMPSPKPKASPDPTRLRSLVPDTPRTGAGIRRPKLI